MPQEINIVSFSYPVKNEAFPCHFNFQLDAMENIKESKVKYCLKIILQIVNSKYNSFVPIFTSRFFHEIYPICMI